MSTIHTFSFVLFFLVTILHSSKANIQQTSNSPAYTLQQYGSAETTLSYLLTLQSSTEQIIKTTCTHTPSQPERPIITDYSITTAITPTPAVYNLTLNLAFDAWVGVADFQISVTTKDENGTIYQYEHTDKHQVYGVCLHTSSGIVSGDNSTGFSFENYQSALDGTNLSVLIHAPEQQLQQLTGVKTIIDGDMNAKNMFPEDSIKLVDDQLSITPAKFRVGINIPIRLEFEGLEIDSESFETVIIISVNGTAPTAVQTTGLVNITINNNEDPQFSVQMFNLGNITGCQCTLGDVVFMGVLPGNKNVEKVKFIADRLPAVGVYPVVVEVKGEDGEFENALNVGSLKASVPAPEKHYSVQGRRPWILVLTIGLGCLLLIVVVVTVVAMAVRSNRLAASDEASFSDGTASFVGEEINGLHIARDIYGRGSAPV